MIAPGEITERNALAVLEEASAYLAQHGIAQSKVAAAIGASPAYLSILFGKSARLYHSNPPLAPKTRDKLLRALAGFIEEHGRQDRAPKNFINTQVFELVLGAARTVKSERMIGIVTGPAGMGKTECARFIAADTELPGTMLVEVNYGSQYASGLMRAAFNAAREHGRTRTVVRFDHVVERLKGSGRLLIVDQAHNLHNSALRVIQDLHDAVQIPILLLGTIDIRNRLADANDPLFTQLSSRVGLRIDLPTELLKTGPSGRARQWISTEQLRKLLRGGKLKLRSDTLAQLVRIANFDPGYLRRAQYLFRLAGRYARNEQREGRNRAGLITPEHLEEAVRLVEGEARALPRIEPAEPEEATA